jgi:hypothetical protein
LEGIFGVRFQKKRVSAGKLETKAKTGRKSTFSLGFWKIFGGHLETKAFGQMSI